MRWHIEQWLDWWLETGYECKRNNERVPIRSKIAWFLAYKIGLG